MYDNLNTVTEGGLREASPSEMESVDGGFLAGLIAGYVAGKLLDEAWKGDPSLADLLGYK
jgi:hypothetical protein